MAPPLDVLGERGGDTSGEAIGAGESREITPWEAGIVSGGMGWFNDSRRSCCRAADPCESGSMVWIRGGRGGAGLKSTCIYE
jgi:hypothetical protein